MGLKKFGAKPYIVSCELLADQKRFWMLALAAALLLMAPIRRGDLAGYDDAGLCSPIQRRSFARAIGSISKATAIRRWNILLDLFGCKPPCLVSLDSLISWRSCRRRCAAWGTVLLVYWLAKRLLQNEQLAQLSMFVMLATPYFIKYTSHGMTDVPFTFLFFSCYVRLAEGRGPSGLVLGSHGDRGVCPAHSRIGRVGSARNSGS